MQEPLAALERPTIEPERAAHLQRQLLGLTTSILDRVVAELASAPSTGSASERILLAALRPQLPKLKPLLLSKLSEADPAGLEAVLGAISDAIESVLYWAPGTPLPRRRFDFDADGRLILVLRDAPTDG